MDTTQRLVQTWMASGRDEEVEETVAGTLLTYSFRYQFSEIIIRLEITNERTTLTNVVKGLGEYLTSQEDALRTKGIQPTLEYA
jgi:DNA repair/transcription protein MET18/MMS19